MFHPRPGWPLAPASTPAPQIVPGAETAARALTEHPDSATACARLMARRLGARQAQRIVQAMLTELQVIQNGGVA